MKTANNLLQPTSLSHATSLKEIAEFWDTHSLADHWDQTTEVHFDVRATPRHRILIDSEVYSKLEERARKRGILPETLVHLWLMEKLQMSM